MGETCDACDHMATFDAGMVSLCEGCLEDVESEVKSGRDRVFDGEIRSGFSRYYRREKQRGESDTVSVHKQKRKHQFGRGYSDSGPKRQLTEDLTERQARAVRDLLDDWLDERDAEETDS